MNELSGTAAVGIETVEWLDAGGGNLTVRVTGRWRRRRPASSGQVTLVIEADGRRHRFPAMPEPPSLQGAGPGMWRLSFSVPGWLAPGMGSRTWLSIGTVTVSLPTPEVAPPGSDVSRSEFATPSPSPSAAADAECPVAASTSEIERAWRRADEAERRATEFGSRVEGLERELEEVGSVRDRLAASVAEGDRNRRIAEQRAHAEQALRRDLARQLASSGREAERAREAMGELAAAEDRIRALEGQLQVARRHSDEAEQAAAAAIARAHAERDAPRPGTEDGKWQVGAEAARIGFERRLRARPGGAGARVPAEPSPPPIAELASRPPALALEPATPCDPDPAGDRTGTFAPGLVDTLRRELDARAAMGAALRARMVAAETRLAARVLLDQRTATTLRELRTELDGLRGALEGERARRRAAQLRVGALERELGGQRELSRDAYDAIGELRGALHGLGGRGLGPPSGSGLAVAVPHGDAPAAGAGPVEPARLTDALTRLRESVAPPDLPSEPAAAGLPVPVGRPAIGIAFRRLVKVDAEAAGRLLLELVALQRVAYPHPIAYDLVLGPGRGCVQVSVGESAARVRLAGAARTRDEVDFRVVGEPARIARLLTAHGIWRRIGFRVARVRGRRGGLGALQALLALPADPLWLRDAGMTLSPSVVLSLAAGMVDPAWTRGERFAMAHEDPGSATIYLLVSDGRPLEVTAAPPPGRIATTIVGPPGALVALLSGAPAPEARIVGDEGPLTTLRGWLKRARSG